MSDASETSAPVGPASENAGAASPTDSVVVDSDAGPGATGDFASAAEGDASVAGDAAGDGEDDDEQAASPRAVAKARTGFIAQTTGAERERFVLNNWLDSFDPAGGATAELCTATG